MSGIRAKDFGTHTENSDYIQSIDNQARIADLFVTQIKEENKEGLEMLALDEETLSGSYSIEYFFSTIFVGATLALAYTQYRIIRAHMISRKYIWKTQTIYCFIIQHKNQVNLAIPVDPITLLQIFSFEIF